MNSDEMYVTKRNLRKEIMSFDKILKRIKKVGQEANIKINFTSLAIKVIDQLYDGISTTKIDELTCEQCASLCSTHPDYNVLAGYIANSNHHKNTKNSFYQVVKELYNHEDKNNNHYPLVSYEFYKTICSFGKEKVDSICDYKRDYYIDYFGFKTLERAYLMRINKRIIERPQHMWLRVAFGIHDKDIEKVIQTYNYMSNKYFTHATPTLFNAGTPKPQLSSCYLMSMEDDSIEGIFNTLKDCALISKWAGGIGLHIHNIRASGSQIRGTNGHSNGIVPMLKVFNNTAKYVDQCLTPNTWIYAKRGPQKICNLSTNDEIVNKNGDYEKIDKILEHRYNNDMLVITDEYSINSMTVTPEHPILVLSSQDKIRLLEKKQISLDYIESQYLQENDYLVYSIPTFENDEKSISKEDCYFYGILIGYGNMVQLPEQNESNFQIVMDRNEHSLEINYCKNYLKDKYIPYKKKEVKESDNTTLVILEWDSSPNFLISYSDLYNENGIIRIQSKWLHLPINKIQYILKGALRKSKSLDSFLILHESRELLETIRYMLLRLGVLSQGKENSGEFHSLHTSYSKTLCDIFQVTYDPKKDHTIRYENYLFSKITKIEIKKYNGLVYDLQMPINHNYMIHNSIVHNGGGKRNGSFAIYLEPWHADVELFLQMRKNHGDEELKARDLFYALWVPDLFMERVKDGKNWTLMCPSECPGLSDVFGDEFNKLYEHYELTNKGRKTIAARDLWFQILDSQMETGTPYLLFKDASNYKSNQKNLGTIKSSNLCVSPNTQILTSRGYYPIYSLWPGNYPESQNEKYKTVEVWNGKEFSEVEIIKTGENVSFIDVSTSDGCNLTCTPYHKFYIRNGDGTSCLKEAKDLTPGDLIEKSSFPLIDGTESFDCDEDALQNACKIGIDNLQMTKETLHSLDVPINYNLRHKLIWFISFIEPYLVQTLETNTTTLFLKSVSKEFVEDLKYLLQTIGVNVIIEQNDNFNLILTITQMRYIFNIDHSIQFNTITWNGLPLNDDELSSLEMNPNVRVVSLKNSNKIDDSYCFNEPKQHAGIFNGIRTSQCTEIIEYSDKDETAVCNLASIALPAFIENNSFNYSKLHDVSRTVTYNLNKVIDINFYPTEKTKKSNFRHRPIGIGVQGLADVFFLLNIPFTSDEAKTINKNIFETIYHAALTESCKIAKIDGPYESFKGSPTSEGILQFDLWKTEQSERYNWNELRNEIKLHGLRNSLLMAPMPTASTSQILGYNECIEPITSNIYSRRTLAGEFILTNKYLMNELLELNLWNETIKNHMITNNGSIQQLEYIPKQIREKYKTVWEIPMKDLIDMAADRGAYICQSQSLNLWLEDPNYNTMTSMHFYSWKKGLKTGIYYLRRRPRHHAQQFTVEPTRKTNDSGEDICEMCSA